MRNDRSVGIVLTLRGDLVFGPATRVFATSIGGVVLGGDHALVVCDLSRVARVDSSGLAALVSAQQDVRRAGGRFVLLRPTERLRTMLTNAHLLRLVEIADDEGDVLGRGGTGVG